MTDSLQDFITRIDRSVVAIFNVAGMMRPMWRVVTASGRDQWLPSPPFDKDTTVLIMRQFFVEQNVVRYVFIDEAWHIETKRVPSDAELRRWRRHGIHDHPDRVEVLFYSGEDHGKRAVDGEAPDHANADRQAAAWAARIRSFHPKRRPHRRHAAAVARTSAMTEISGKLVNSLLRIVRTMAPNDGDAQLTILTHALAVGCKSCHVPRATAIEKFAEALDVPHNLVDLDSAEATGERIN